MEKGKKEIKEIEGIKARLQEALKRLETLERRLETL